MNSINKIKEQESINEIEIISEINIIKLKTIDYAHSEWVLCIIIDNNNNLYTGGNDGKICIFNKSFFWIKTIYSSQFVQSLCIYENILICGGFTNLVFYDINKNYKEILNLNEYHNGTIKQIKILNNHYLVSGSFDRKFKIMDLKTFKVVIEYNNFEEKIYSIETQKNKIYVGGESKLFIYFFNIVGLKKNFKNIYKFNDLHLNNINKITIFKNKYIITISEDKSLKIINIIRYDILIHYKFDFCLKDINILKNYLIIVGKASNMYIYEIIGDKNIVMYKILNDIHEDWINCLVLSNNKLFIGSDDCNISIFKIESKTDHQLNNILNNLNKMKQFNDIQIKLNLNNNYEISNLNAKLSELQNDFKEKNTEVENLKKDLKLKNNLILNLKDEVNQLKQNKN